MTVGRRRRPSVVLAVVVAGALVLAGCSDDNSSAADSTGDDAASTTTTTTAAPTGPAPSPGCDATEPSELAQPGTADHTMTSGGDERVYELIVPDDYDGTKPLPLVLGLHSLTVSYAIVPGMSGFPDMEGPYDFIAVAPSGELDQSVPYWVAAQSDPNRDVQYIDDLLDLLEDELCIDTSEVFSTGMSNGGQLSSLLACVMPDRLTAVAPIAGVEFSGECEGEPVPVMAFHGAADPIVPYTGGGLDAERIADIHFWKGDEPEGVPKHDGVDGAMARWAENNGCDAEPVEERVSPEVIKRTWQNCEADTVLYVVENGGHAWPGKPVPAFEPMFGHATTDIDATNLMFEFFFGPPPGQ